MNKAEATDLNREVLARAARLIVDNNDSIQAQNGICRMRDAVSILLFSQVGEGPAVEPKEWPDAIGVWCRYGDLYYAARRPSVTGLSIRRMTAELWCDQNEALGRGLRGQWVECTVHVPPIAQPKPVPPAPPRWPFLYAESAAGWDWWVPDSLLTYLWRDKDGAGLTASMFINVDRGANSDWAAVARYDAGMKDLQAKG